MLSVLFYLYPQKKVALPLLKIKKKKLLKKVARGKKFIILRWFKIIRTLAFAKGEKFTRKTGFVGA
jgi:hypothetical protein